MVNWRSPKPLLGVRITPVPHTKVYMDNLKPSIFNRIKTFLGEVRIEAKKVTWSTRKELIASTVVIAAMVFVVAGFIWLIDFLLSLLMKLILG